MFSVGLPVRVYVRRRIIEYPDIRECYSDRTAWSRL